jgi:two-component system chemotaxis sensor kinase CheA
MQIEDDEILQGFIEESLEHLADIETDLLAIEKAGANIDENLVNKVFRAAHSIKGGAGFMGLTVIQELSHAMENILGMIRSKKLVPNPEIVNVLLQGSDKLEFMINNIQTSNEEDISEHLIPLNAIADVNNVPVASPPPPTVPEPVTTEAVIQEAPVIVQDTPGQQEASAPVVPPPEPISYSPSPPSTPIPVTPSPMETSSGPTMKADTSLRVHVSLLDSLMTLAGELVLSRNQLLQTISTNDLRNAEAVGQRIDLITSELQEAIMLTRMQPIGNVFSKFPRVVRDLSKQLNKTIDLTIVGNEVELDKTIIESINDPLTHLIRNSVDHGVEMPAERKRLGKSEKGLIILKAYHEAGQVVIQISDDGKGLDGEALAASAISKGLISAEQAQIMSDKERINIIFLPGFSMAKKVTDVSGRGVGMDVVKTNLDKLGGQVEIASEVGKGTTISIKLPLTLAIIPCQIITTSNERYAIPQVNLEELLRIPANQVKNRVEKVGNAEVVRLRGNLLPLIRLSDVIEAERSYWDSEEDEQKADRRESIADRRGKHSPLFKKNGESVDEEHKIDSDNRASSDRRYSTASALNIVVVSTNSMKYGLIVDRLQDSEEIVIKPLGRHLQHCKGYAGATIMGDGRIALILDVTNLARMAHLTSIDGTDRANEVALAAEELIRTQKDRQALLIFRSSEHEQFAVPLNQVERIEKIKRSEIENMGGKRVMQYRGGSLALFTVDDISKVQPIVDHDNLLVIVFNLCSKPIGLLAIGPVDAVEISSEIDGLTLKQSGIMGSIIIDGKTTMLIDIFEIVQTLFPDWFAEKPVFEAVKVPGITPTILIAEDSNFFRNQVKGYMTESGYNVLEGADGAIAWDLLQKHADEISMVVTDIEMPNMNGFELTEIIRKNPIYNKIPIIALTTLAAEEDIAKGKAVGIDEYHIKLDKEKLMTCVHDYIKRLH